MAGAQLEGRFERSQTVWGGSEWDERAIGKQFYTIGDNEDSLKISLLSLSFRYWWKKGMRGVERRWKVKRNGVERVRYDEGDSSTRG